MPRKMLVQNKNHHTNNHDKPFSLFLVSKKCTVLFVAINTWKKENPLELLLVKLEVSFHTVIINYSP